VLEISCERLYVRWVDAPATASPAQLAGAASGWREEAGEPPAILFLETRVELLGQLDASLAGAGTVRLLDPEWLADAELRREVDRRVAVFRQRGGRVESPARSTATVASRASRVSTLALLFAAVAAPLAAQPYPDDVLRTRVEAVIAAATDLPADSIAVEVEGGYVTLTGSVLCEGCGGNATPGGAGTVQQSLGAVVLAVPGVLAVRFRLRYRPVPSNR
jgi:hypothetical protein